MLSKREKILIAVLGGVGLLYLLARTDQGSAILTDILTSGARGIRNNNPGNIRKSSTIWAGQAPAAKQTDTAFVIFTDPEYGIRAMAKVLTSYLARGIDTLAEIAATWAPPSENNTAAYIKSLSAHTGLDPNARISAADFPRVIPAIIQHENGEQPYSLETINKGVSLA